MNIIVISRSIDKGKKLYDKNMNVLINTINSGGLL